MLEFMAALYNEESQIESLLSHVKYQVDRIVIVDDGSTDYTPFLLGIHAPDHIELFYDRITHTGLPETVKARALQHIKPDSWVVMLDADERLGSGVWSAIQDFLYGPDNKSKDITHVWFTLKEYIDGQETRTFQKCRLFRASAAHFSTSVHEDDTFTGQGAFFGWTVIHSKSREKQIQREIEYIQTYDKLLNEGKITKERIQELKNMHYFVR